MKAFMYIWALVFLVGGCAKERENPTEANFDHVYGGKPFKGTAKGVLEREGLEDYIWSGEGVVTLVESSGDSVSMVFLADFGSGGEINFKLRGKIDDTAFLLEAEDSANFFRIVNDKITGNIENDAQEMRFEGTMGKEQAKMTAEVYFKEENDPFPKGSTLHLNFDTSREITDDNDDGSGCQMRLVPIWSPNGVTMGMVPDC